MSLKANIQKAYEDAQTGKFLQPTEAGIKVRILTFKDQEGQEQIVRRVDSHFISEDGKKGAGINCLRSIGYDCPVCEEVERMVTGDEEEKKYAKKIAARKRFYFMAINSQVDPAKQKPQTLALGKSAFDQVMSYFIDPEWEQVLLGPLANGRDFVISKKGSGLDTEYTVKTSPVPSKISQSAASKTYDPINDMTFEGMEEAQPSAVPAEEPDQPMGVEPESEVEAPAPPPAKASVKAPVKAPVATKPASKALPAKAPVGKPAPAKGGSLFDRLRKKGA